MNDPKTTISGLVGGVAFIVSQAYPAQAKLCGVIAGIAILLIGYFSKDAKKAA